MDIHRYDDGSPWTKQFGYVRALRVGDRILVSGTTGTEPDGSPVGDDTYSQTKAALAKIVDAVESLASDATIIRTRVYLVNIDEWQDAGRAHMEAFGDDPPVNATIGIDSLVGEGLLVEVEAEAIVRSPS